MVRRTGSAWRWLLAFGLWLMGACAREMPPRDAAGDSLGDSLGAVAVAANAREQADDARPAEAASRSGVATGGGREFGARTGFRSRARLVDHFEKHGAEFGGITMAEYLRRAQALRDAPVGGDVLEIVRSDGVVSRFDRASGAFLAFDADGTIRTFFRPNDGESYFRRQARRRGSR